MVYRKAVPERHDECGEREVVPSYRLPGERSASAVPRHLRSHGPQLLPAQSGGTIMQQLQFSRLKTIFQNR